MSGEKTHENLKDVSVRSGDWFSCPFCGSTGITSEFTSFGTTLTCNGGCHGEFIFPAYEAEVMALWKRTKRRQENNQVQRRPDDKI